jgi:hypothetical protein
MAAPGLTAPGTSTWDIPATPARRPGLKDLNGVSLVDVSGKAPNSPTMPSAALLNTGDALAIAFGRLVSNAKVSVKFVAGAPTLDSMTSANTAANTSPAANVTIGRTPSFVAGFSAAGDTVITFMPGTMPGPVCQPGAKLNIVCGTHNYSIGCVAITLAPTTWVASTAFATNSYCQPTSAQAAAQGLIFLAQSTSGDTKTGTTEPVWPTAIGGTVVDNHVTWYCVGGATGVRVTTCVDSVLTDEPYTAEVD